MDSTINNTKNSFLKSYLILILIFVVLITLGARKLMRQANTSPKVPLKITNNINIKSNGGALQAQNKLVVETREMVSKLIMTEILDGGKLSGGDLSIGVGTPLMWTNKDESDHTILFVGEMIKSGSMKKGDSFTRMFSEVGTYRLALDNEKNVVAVINVK